MQMVFKWNCGQSLINKKKLICVKNNYIMNNPKVKKKIHVHNNDNTLFVNSPIDFNPC